MSTAPLAFAGVSTYSDDLQQILQRAVSIANLPVKNLQQQQSDNLQKKQALIAMGSAVATLSNSLQNLGSLASNKSLVASSSDNNVVTATATGATQPVSYNITNVTSLARTASEISVQGYSDSSSAPVSADGDLQLVYGDNTYDITLAPGQNNLVGLSNAINALGVGVSASIITTGTGATPNYLAVSANTPGATTLQLNDVPSNGPTVNLISNTNQGANTEFDLNGIHVSSPSTSINNVVPGLTLNFQNTTTAGENVSVSLASDPSQLSSALQSFVTAYNAVADQLNAQKGSGAGALAGDFVIQQLSQNLRQLTSYSSGSGTVQSLASMGVTLDATGHMSFDASTFNSLTNQNLADAFSFLGSTTTGLGAYGNTLAQVSDPVAGLIRTEEDGVDKANDHISDQVNNLNQRISVMQNNLTLQLQAADALLGKLQSQQQIITASVQSVDLTMFGKNFGQASQ